MALALNFEELRKEYAASLITFSSQSNKLMPNLPRFSAECAARGSQVDRRNQGQAYSENQKPQPDPGRHETGYRPGIPRRAAAPPGNRMRHQHPKGVHRIVHCDMQKRPDDPFSACRFARGHIRHANVGRLRRDVHVRRARGQDLEGGSVFHGLQEQFAEDVQRLAETAIEI